MIIESSPVDHGLSEGGGGDTALTTVPIVYVLRVNNMYIQYIARHTQHSLYKSSHAIASSEEVKKLRISK